MAAGSRRGLGPGRDHGEGSQAGALLCIKPAGKRLSVRGMDFYRFRDGRLAEHWDNVDEFGMLSQLGDLG